MPPRSPASTARKAPAASTPAGILEDSIETVEHHLAQALAHLQAAKKLYTKQQREARSARKPPAKP